MVFTAKQDEFFEALYQLLIVEPVYSDHVFDEWLELAILFYHRGLRGKPNDKVEAFKRWFRSRCDAYVELSIYPADEIRFRLDQLQRSKEVQVRPFLDEQLFARVFDFLLGDQVLDEGCFDAWIRILRDFHLWTNERGRLHGNPTQKLIDFYGSRAERYLKKHGSLPEGFRKDVWPTQDHEDHIGFLAARKKLESMKRFAGPNGEDQEYWRHIRLSVEIIDNTSVERLRGRDAADEVDFQTNNVDHHLLVYGSATIANEFAYWAPETTLTDCRIRVLLEATLEDLRERTADFRKPVFLKCSHAEPRSPAYHEDSAVTATLSNIGEPGFAHFLQTLERQRMDRPSRPLRRDKVVPGQQGRPSDTRASDQAFLAAVARFEDPTLLIPQGDMAHHGMGRLSAFSVPGKEGAETIYLGEF